MEVMFRSFFQGCNQRSVRRQSPSTPHTVSPKTQGKGENIEAALPDRLGLGSLGDSPSQCSHIADDNTGVWFSDSPRWRQQIAEKEREPRPSGHTITTTLKLPLSTKGKHISGKRAVKQPLISTNLGEETVSPGYRTQGTLHIRGPSSDKRGNQESGGCSYAQVLPGTDLV